MNLALELGDDFDDPLSDKMDLLYKKLREELAEDLEWEVIQIFEEATMQLQIARILIEDRRDNKRDRRNNERNQY